MDNPDPLENRSSAIKALYRNYELRVEEAKRRARRFVNFNFILLGLAALSVICAPLIALEDIEKSRSKVEKSQSEIEKSRLEIQKLINSEEKTLEKIENRIAELQVSLEQRDESAEKLEMEQLKTRRKRIAQSLNDTKKSQRESILGISDSNSSDFSIVLFQIDFLRIGLLTVLILMSQHMIKLARYNFRLMTFYRARQDVLLMTTKEALPWSTLTPVDLDQATIALSPDYLDPELSSKTPIEMLRQLASWRIKPTSGQ